MKSFITIMSILISMLLPNIAHALHSNHEQYINKEIIRNTLDKSMKKELDSNMKFISATKVQEVGFVPLGYFYNQKYDTYQILGVVDSKNGKQRVLLSEDKCHNFFNKWDAYQQSKQEYPKLQYVETLLGVQTQTSCEYINIEVPKPTKHYYWIPNYQI